MITVSPSLLAADFSILKEELIKVSESGAEFIHLDVMDGHFVPNISFGIPVIKSLRKVSDLFFDTHLMISDPLFYIKDFSNAGSDMITFHIECDSDINETINAIKKENKKCGISIKPKTPVSALIPYLDKIDSVLVMSVEPGFGGQKFMPEVLPKIEEIRALKPDIMISVDGGIDDKTAPLVKKAGADTLVAGSYYFKSSDKKEAVRILKA
jgi:ribulose-phosphate 3-epimerase